MSHNNILWIYIILLVIGGLIGFFKGKSKVSLIMSVCFAAALSLCAAGYVFQPGVADILLVALLVLVVFESAYACWQFSTKTNVALFWFKPPEYRGRQWFAD